MTLEVVTPDYLSGQQFSDDTVPVAHIRAENWGWYLFGLIPLIAGDTEHTGYPSLFSHTVKLDELVEAVTERSRALGATVTDLQSTDKSTWVPITLILWIREIEISGNASRPAPAEPP